MPRALNFNLGAAGAAGISSGTLAVIVVIVAVIGYIIIERGGDKAGQGTDTVPVIPVPVVTQPPTVTTAPQPTKPPPINTTTPKPASTPTAPSTPIPPSTPTTALPETPIESTDWQKRARPTNGQKPAAGGVLKNGGERRPKANEPARQGRKVNFPGGVDNQHEGSGLFATDIRKFNRDAPSTRYHSGNDELEGAHDALQKIKHAEVAKRHISPLRYIRADLEKGGEAKAKLLRLMEEIEGIVDRHWLAGKVGEETDDEFGRKYEKAMKDSWKFSKRWGRVPEVMVDVVEEMVKLEIFDISKLIVAMQQERTIRTSLACPVNAIVDDGFELVDNGDYQAKSAMASIELLLGWFTLPFKAYQLEQWAARVSRKQAGIYVPPSVEKATKGVPTVLLMWLSWAGRRFIINRLFCDQGAELLDGSARLTIAPYNPGKDQDTGLFRLEMILFVPESTELESFIKARESAHWMYQSYPQEDGKEEWLEEKANETKHWDGYWLREALVYCILEAQAWIETKCGMVTITTNQEHERAINRIVMRRLIIRPGFARDRVDLTKGQSLAPSPSRGYVDERKPITMQLDPKDLDWASGNWPHPTEEEHTASNMALTCLKETMSFLKCTSIRFFNKRQHDWYTPATPLAIETDIDTARPRPAAMVDRFDPRQVAFMLGLLSYALEPKTRPHKFRYTTDETMSDTIRNSARAERTEFARLSVEMDFGGLVPFLPDRREGESHVGVRGTFPWANVFQASGVDVFYLPWMVGQDASSLGIERMCARNTKPCGSWHHQTSLPEWLSDPRTFLCETLKKRNYIVIVVHTASSETEDELHRAIVDMWVDLCQRVPQTVFDSDKAAALVKEDMTLFDRRLRWTDIARCQTTSPEIEWFRFDLRSRVDQILQRAHILPGTNGQEDPTSTGTNGRENEVTTGRSTSFSPKDEEGTGDIENEYAAEERMRRESNTPSAPPWPFGLVPQGEGVSAAEEQSAEEQSAEDAENEKERQRLEDLERRRKVQRAKTRRR